MAILRIPDQDRVTSDPDEIRAELAAVHIHYERWLPAWSLPPGAAAEEVLAAYDEPIERLKEEGGYAAVDLVDLTPETPGLDGMLAQFSSEHWHDEDEVRLVVEGRGLFHLHPPSSPVLAVEVGPGDLLSVPRGTQHWFDLCSDRRIRAVRLFQDPGGWTPHYTGSGIDAAHLPVCLGPSLPPAASAHRASEQPRAIVLDVEGTTTPIAFVHQRLFAYAAAHLPVFLAAHGEDERIAEHIDELRGQWHEDASSDAAMPAWSDDSFDERMASAARYCAWLSARDRKSTALKALQGYVWRTGYESGELRGEVYEDVPPALAAWRAGGRTVAIYSSGSVLAQRLLFQYAAAGDLTSLISSFFDTRIGAKTEPASYLRLAARLGFPAAQLAFVSDNRHELEAARAAGVIAVACVRPGMRQDDILGHPVVRHLGEVDGVVAGTTTAGKELSPVSPVRVRAEQAAG